MDKDKDKTTASEFGKPFEKGMQQGLNDGVDAHKDRRARLLDVTIKASGRKNVADIPAEDREVLEKHRAKRREKKVTEDGTWIKRRQR